MDEITRVSNGGYQCRLRATVENQPADPKRFSPGDSCMCEEGWLLFKVSLDGVWRLM